MVNNRQPGPEDIDPVTGQEWWRVFRDARESGRDMMWEQQRRDLREGRSSTARQANDDGM